MTTELETSKPGCSTIGFFVWFIGGLSLSFSIIFSLVLLVLLIASIALNVYLGWELSGLQITISRPTPPFPQGMTAVPTAEALVQAPAETPAATEATTPTPVPPEVEVERQVETVAAIATQAAAADVAAFAPPTGTVAAAAPRDPSAPAGEETQAGEDTTLAAPTPAATAPKGEPASSSEQAPRTSSNSYQLIPIEGQRESRPAEEHGDLNLKLREPQPLEVELGLVDAGVGVDPDAPKLSEIFKPEFTAAYTVHDWDWGCNCKGKLIEEKEVVLVGLKTTPGEPVYIPPRGQDIYDKKYYAVVLYASEDSLTFLYSRAGSIVQGYTIHYLGLQTDPNLVALFRESQGSELPGLSLDVPVGVATDELIIAIRDNGKFLDARSKNDWWD